MHLFDKICIMRICNLGSSSSGNCTVVYTNKTKILIDAGLRLSDIKLRLKSINIDLSEINAILLTHEHTDHIKSVGAIMRKYKTPLYVHQGGVGCALQKVGAVDANLVIPFYEQPFEVGEFRVNAFELPHDASVCVGYNIVCDDKKFSIATDLGYATFNIVKNLYDSKMVILESNHDEHMLLNNQNYSAALKARILGKFGHLSNSVAAKVIAELIKNNVKVVMLAHLSEENNTPQTAISTTQNYLLEQNVLIPSDFVLDVAEPYKISKIYHII